jgi:hypothetical protein
MELDMRVEWFHDGMYTMVDSLALHSSLEAGLEMGNFVVPRGLRCLFLRILRGVTGTWSGVDRTSHHGEASTLFFSGTGLSDRDRDQNASSIESRAY